MQTLIEPDKNIISKIESEMGIKFERFLQENILDFHKNKIEVYKDKTEKLKRNYIGVYRNRVNSIRIVLKNEESIPDSIFLLKSLTDLYLRSRLDKIDAIPVELKNLKNLEILDLLLDWVEEIPDWFGEFQFLKHISLPPRIKKIPRDLPNKLNLESLTINCNYLPQSTINEIFQYNNWINLRLANIDLIKYNLNNFNCLTQLSLSVGIIDFNTHTAKLEKLKEFRSRRSTIKNFRQFLNSTPNLITLYLEKVQFDEFTVKIPLLETLIIKHCKDIVKEFPKFIKESLLLTQINLSHNQISNIPEWILNHTNLESLDLSYNKIEQLPKEIFQLPHIKRVNVQGNKLKFDKSFVEEIREKGISLFF